MKSILDKSFRYVPSGQTDVRKTFARFRQEQRKADMLRVQAAIAEAKPLAATKTTVRQSNMS